MFDLRSKRLAVSAALTALGVVGSVGCRDWGRFEPVTGGGDSTGASNSGAGNVGGSNASAGAGGGDQGGGPSGGGPVGGGPASNCGKIDILSDDFDAPLDWRWTADTGVVSVSNGDLVVPHPPTESYFQIETSAGFDFRGRTMVLELSVPPGPGQSLWWDVAGNTDNYLEFYIDTAGTLHFGYEKDGDFQTIDGTDVQFDAVEHRFQRFREENGAAFYDVSADGSRWTQVVVWQLDDVFDPAYTSVYIGGSTNGTTAPDGDMHIARVYAEDPVGSSPCAATTLSDDFDDSERSSAWYDGWTSSTCPIAETGGELRVSCQPGGDESSGYVSSAAYDLTGTSVTIEITDYPESGSSGYLGFGVARPNGADTFYQFEVNNGWLNVIRVLDDDWSMLLSQTYDPMAARFLRIREAGGTAYFETSVDNIQFETFHSEGALFSLSEVLLFVMGGNYLASAPVDVAFDNLNIGP